MNFLVHEFPFKTVKASKKLCQAMHDIFSRMKGYPFFRDLKERNPHHENEAMDGGPVMTSMAVFGERLK